jgi:cytochrome c peroxidase
VLDLGKGRRGRNGKTQDRGFQGRLHRFRSLSLIGVLSAPAALAGDLPPPLTQADFLSFDRRQAALGQLLFYDRILSGNRNIACATCHHPRLGTGDRLSLGIGEGGEGLGTDRVAGSGDSRIKKRIPRNAPGLWNLGAKELHTLFHDGRLSIADTFENGFNSPAEEWLPTGFNSLLAAQAVFPVTAQFEMAGNPKENEVAGAIHDRIDTAWPILAKRVRVIPEYGRRFVEAFDHIDTPEDVTIVEIANALAAFQAVEWQSFDSPFDRFVSGDDAALNDAQKRGLDLFYGEAGCSGCHSGKLLSDQKFHALGLPPFGPGRTRRFDPMVRDVGVMGETDRLEDAYRFRTPMLRNVELTAPYGHNGAYPTLQGIIRHHLNPDSALASWSPETANLPHAPWLEAIDFVVWNDAREMARQARFRDIAPVALTDNDVADLVAFLKSLTGTTSVTTPPLGVPDTVPSGLPVDK